MLICEVCIVINKIPWLYKLYESVRALTIYHSLDLHFFEFLSETEIAYIGE